VYSARVHLACNCSEAKLRHTVLAGVRSCLIGFLAASLLNLPVMAAGAPSIGMIVAADNALLSSAAAQRSVDVCPGDTLTTQANGSLRLAAGSSQLYLLSSTEATMQQNGNTVSAKMSRGTIDFSVAPGQLEVQTPLGVIRGSGSNRAFGQVAMLSPTKLQISAYEGELLVAGADGLPKSIGAGETYVASINPSGGPTDPGILGVGRPRKINWRRVAAAAIIGGGVAIGSYFIYRETTESCSKINCGSK
jgi:hypothetical protein